MLMASSSSLSFFCLFSYPMQMVVQLPCRWWWWWWMRAGESWEASRYVQYAPAVVGPKGSACPLHVAMPSIATFPIDLLASAPSPLKHAIALIAIFSCFSCNFPTVSPNLRLYHSFSPFHHHTNSIGVGWEIGYWSLSYKPATFLICFAIFFFHNGSCIDAIILEAFVAVGSGVERLQLNSASWEECFGIFLTSFRNNPCTVVRII